LINLMLSVITFSLALTLAFGGLGGVTYWFWSQWLPQPSESGLAFLLGYPGRFADITLNTVLGSRPRAVRQLARPRPTRLERDLHDGQSVGERTWNRLGVGIP
jgi:hypothetical protein